MAVYTLSAVLLLISCLLLYTFKSGIPESWKFLIRGRRMLIDLAAQHKDHPFSVAIPGNRLHVVSSSEHWAELNTASLNHLSHHAWSKQHFQPNHTFGYVWPDKREDDGMPVIRAIRTLTNQWPTILKPKFVAIVEEEVENAVRIGDGKIPLWETVKHVASRMNILMMFGDDIANTPEFVDRGVRYIDEVTFVAEAAKNFPAFLMSVLSFLIRGRDLNKKYIWQVLAAEVKRYRATAPTSEQGPSSILEGLARNLEEAPNIRIEHDMNITLVASTTSTPIIATHLIHDIFTHPEWIPALRTELKDVLYSPKADLNKLPLLESFLVESMRTHCFLSTVNHRVPLKPFTFKDGYTVPQGEVVEYYQYATMNDDALYPEPSKFVPERHIHTGRKATDMGLEWPFWGNSRIACPGRFHVANIAKLIAAHFVMNYDCEVESKGALDFEFREVLVPSPGVKLVMRKRE